MERTAGVLFPYELVSESGEPLGNFGSEESTWEVGDLIPCSGHMFEIRAIEDKTLHVRRVI